MEVDATNLCKSQASQFPRKLQSPVKGDTRLSLDSQGVETVVDSKSGNIALQQEPSINSVGPTSLLDKQPASTDLDPFRNPITLPNSGKSTILIYPHSGSVIEERYMERFEVVVNILKRNVESEPDLKSYSSEVDYTLKMCGEAPDKSHPSIIVFCRNCYFHKLKSILTSKNVAWQYYLPNASRWKILISRLKHAPTQDKDALYLPRFKIYFWCSVQRPRILYWGRLNDIVVERPCMYRQKRDQKGEQLPATWCGSKVVARDGSKLATLTCLLKVDSQWYGLTAQHCFVEDEERTFPRMEALQEGQPQDLGSIESMSAWEANFEEDDFVVDDVEYEVEVDDTQTDNLTHAAHGYNANQGQLISQSTREPNPGANSISSFSQRVRELYYKSNSVDVMETHLIFPTIELEYKGEPDLDWALIKVEEAHKRSNLFHTVEPRGSISKDLEQFAHRHPGEEREVLIMCSPFKCLRGILLCGQSVLGGINRPGSASVWNVVLSRGESKM